MLQQKTRGRDGPTRVVSFENGETLPWNESSPTGRAKTAVELAERHKPPDDEERCRKKDRPSGPIAYVRDKRERTPQPGGTRVRFKFARRAHQRKITPKLGINRVLRVVKEKELREWEIVLRVAWE